MIGQPYHVHDCGACGYWTPCVAPGNAYGHGCECETCGAWIPPAGPLVDHVCFTDDTVCAWCGSTVGSRLHEVCCERVGALPLTVVMLS